MNADGSALILDTNVVSTSNDRQEFAILVGQLCDIVGIPTTLLADAGYAGEQIVAALDARSIEPLIAVSRLQAERPYDFRPPKKITKPPPEITAPWRIAMQEKLQTHEAKDKYRKRKQTIEPVFGIIKSILGFTRFHLRGIENVKNERTLIALAHNCKRLSKLVA
ncbi:MAG: transposase [Hyphomicrobiales bacterium]|nr:transposase [Hyphomicrobiales bacterium]